MQDPKFYIFSRNLKLATFLCTLPLCPCLFLFYSRKLTDKIHVSFNADPIAVPTILAKSSPISDINTPLFCLLFCTKSSPPCMTEANISRSHNRLHKSNIYTVACQLKLCSCGSCAYSTLYLSHHIYLNSMAYAMFYFVVFLHLYNLVVSWLFARVHICRIPFRHT